MNKKLSKELKKYYKKIDALLICNKAEKKKIISDLKADIEIKIEDGSITSIDDVINIFGTPESIVPEYKDSDVLALRNIRRIVIRSIIIVSAILILIAVTYFAYEAISNYIEGNGYIIVDVNPD